MSRRHARWLAPLALVLGYLGVIAVQAVLAANRTYLPADPGFSIDLVAQPENGIDRTGRPIEIAVLGDSLVAGLGVDDPRDSLPGQIAQQLADELGRAVHVTGFGVSGAITHDVATKQRDQLAALRPRPDAVVVEVGSNDVTHRTPPWKMRRITRNMLRAVRDAAGGAPVVLGSAGKLDTPNFQQPLRITIVLAARVYRRAQRQAARDEGARFMDVPREVSPQYDRTPGATSSDAFHPAAPGYELWAAPLVSDVVAALEPSGA